MNDLRQSLAHIMLVGLVLATGTALAQDKPNILVVWGDDIGHSNISTFTRGMMGYRTPNIDRIASEGMAFTDYHGEQSCTVGRSSFIARQRFIGIRSKGSMDKGVGCTARCLFYCSIGQ